MSGLLVESGVMDNNLDLESWVNSCLFTGAGATDPVGLKPLTGDAGFRTYYRVEGAPGRIAVYAPPAHENNLAFVAKDTAFRTAGVKVPEIFAVEFERGFMLLEDLGDDLLLPLLNQGTAMELYQRAERELLLVQLVCPDRDTFPAYDEQQLRLEMELFPEWFVTRLLGVTPDRQMCSVIEKTFAILVQEARAQPQVVVHRDYHSRNLMLLSEGRSENRIGVIDFQDAVVGPVTYDLVSLLKDCYIRWPVDLVRRRALDYGRRATAAGIMPAVADEQFLRWFDLMGLQRHIKVLGIFARLWLRDGKARYLDDLPLVIRYTLEAANQYPETREFAAWFEERLLPLVADHRWHQGEHLKALAAS